MTEITREKFDRGSDGKRAWLCKFQEVLRVDLYNSFFFVVVDELVIYLGAP